MVAWIFLVASLWGAWFTWNAHRPVYHLPRFGVFGFFAGWLTKELAFHHLALQGLLTLGFVWAGALESWPGKLGLAITIASWVGLGLVIWRAREAEHIVAGVLGSGFEESEQASMPEPLRAVLPAGIRWRKVAFPFPIRDPAVERHRDLVYARAGGINLKLDVYRHRDRPQGCPVLVQVHGGGWVIGTKDEQGLPLMNQLASHGWVCVALNYRLSPHATFPDHLVDVKRALAWVQEHIAEYGGDPGFVVLTGGSAGGHLASLAALTPNDPRYQPGFEGVDTSVKACVSFYGVYDFTDTHRVWPHAGLKVLLERRVMKASIDEARDRYEDASPVHQAGPQAPPFFVIHGDHDTLVPVGDARHFVAALREASREPVLYAELPHTQHAFEIFPSLRTAYVLNGVERFLALIRARHLAQRSGADGEEAEALLAPAS